MPDKTSPFHRGETAIQSRLGIRDEIEKKGRRVILDHVPERSFEFFAQLPLLPIGTVDDSGRPWASILVGKSGFVRAIDSGRLTVRARPIYGDPLNKALTDGASIAALGISFEPPDRFRVNGKVDQVARESFDIVVKQGFPNCPGYIQSRTHEIGNDIEDVGNKKVVNRGNTLSKTEAALIARSDTFFIASHYTEETESWSHGVDVSHRGGKPGFVIVAHESLLLFPDYAGNCMFTTLGNIEMDSRCGLLFVDYDTGDTLQLTGKAEVLWGREHTARFPGAERVVSIQITEVIHVQSALPLTWRFKGYNPVFETMETGIADSETPVPHSAMRLKSVNVSLPKEVPHEGKAVATGIFKEPVEGRIMLQTLNLEGDGQADLWGHGGAFRAVYVYSFENYEYWANRLGRDDFAIGQFGENFTVEGMLDDEICIGDVFRIGEALVEVSQPRIPCYKLALKIGMEGFQNQFLKSGRVGFYFRVLEEGEVGAGDEIVLVKRDPEGMTVESVSNLLFFDTENLKATEKALYIAALAHGWKGSFAERLTKAGKVTEKTTGFRTMIVDRKVPESRSITSFYLVPKDGDPICDFLPGQFLTFELNVPNYDKPVLRTYTISDAPGLDYYRVTIKREPSPADQADVPPGLSSNYFHDQVEVGTRLSVGAPRGKFHLNPSSERAVVLLSSGVGLTPMISMMNAIVASGSARPVWFIHGARNGDEHAMGAYVRRITDERDNVHVHICYSQPNANDREGVEFDSKGRVNIDLLKQLLPFDDFDFYLCGPPPFMRSLYCGLLSVGMSEERIHYEFFGPGSILHNDSSPIGQEDVQPAETEITGGLQVEFSRSGKSVTWDPKYETILELAEQHGLDPDYSCRSGICHTCKCAILEGKVDYIEEPLNDPGEGNVLICCARPKTNLVIDV
jgi:MOSC domain-containing protein YiiM/ferredoxin-NADP reductase/predicted pyridoxine 5'-phosphate oxidase superfamily flavin-nucleotide-binding protein